MMLKTFILLSESGGILPGGDNLLYFLIAYLLLWGLILGYLFYLHGRVTDLEEKISGAFEGDDENAETPEGEEME